MSGRETHFELFLRKNTKSSWVLFDACSSRNEAVEKARVLIRSHPDGGVRVLKETRDLQTGDYDSVVVATVGNCAETNRRKSREFQLAASSSCIAPTDLFKPEARKTYQEVMPRFLNRYRVLPGELVYRTDLLEQLEATGSEITQAIQRVAIARAGGGEELHSTARQLHEMVSDAINLCFKDKKSGHHLKFDQPLPEIVAKARKKPNPQNAFSSALADRLRTAPNWKDKLGKLLEIWEEVETLPEADRQFCNEILSHYFSEWIEAPNTLGVMLGDLSHGAEKLDRLIAVLEPRNLYAPGEDPLSALPTAQTLARAVSLGVLPTARNRIISLIFEELSCNRRLFPENLKGELDLLKTFGDRLVRLLGGERQSEMYEAFCSRSNTLMTMETVEDHLAAFPLGERPNQLLALSNNIAGDTAKSKLVGVFRGYLSQPQFEVAVLGTKNPIAMLNTLRNTQQQLLSSKLPSQDKLHGARDIDTLGVRLIGQSQLFRNMIKKAGTAEKAALALFRLAAETLPHGQSAALAAGTASRLLQTEGTRERLDGQPDMKMAMAQLARIAQTASTLDAA